MLNNFRIYSSWLESKRGSPAHSPLFALRRTEDLTTVSWSCSTLPRNLLHDFKGMATVTSSATELPSCSYGLIVHLLLLPTLPHARKFQSITGRRRHA